MTSSCSSWSSSYSRKRLCRELLARQDRGHLLGVGQGRETGQNCVGGSVGCFCWRTRLHFPGSNDMKAGQHLSLACLNL